MWLDIISTGLPLMALAIGFALGMFWMKGTGNEQQAQRPATFTIAARAWQGNRPLAIYGRDSFESPWTGIYTPGGNTAVRPGRHRMTETRTDLRVITSGHEYALAHPLPGMRY